MKFRLVCIVALLIAWNGLWSQCIDGQEYIECFYDSVQYSFCDTSQEVVSWSIYPSSNPPIFNVVNEHSISVFFTNSGSYQIMANVLPEVGQDSLLITYVLDVEVFLDFDEGLEWIGCVESEPGCDRVCVGEVTEIFLQEEMTITVDGATDVEYLDDRVRITWGEEGNGSIAYYIPPCIENIECIKVMPIPVADIQELDGSGGNTITACLGEEVVFENLSYDGQSYQWSFGDGTLSEFFDESHTYVEPGIYEVVFSAMGVCSCVDRDTLIVEVLDVWGPQMTCISTVCPNTTETYQLVSDDCSSYDWEVSPNGTIISGGGNTDDFIEIEWASGPEGLVSVLPLQCNSPHCPDPTVFRVPIITTDGPINGPEEVCRGDIVTYTAPYWESVIYDWNVSGSGKIISKEAHSIAVEWPYSGTGTVSVDYSNCFLECHGSDEMEVRALRLVDITHPWQMCQGDTLWALGHIEGQPQDQVAMNWIIKNSSGQVVSQVDGTAELALEVSWAADFYNISAIPADPDYCDRELSGSFVVTATPPQPIDIIGRDEICPGVLMEYSVVKAGNYGTQWEILDGSTVHTYTGDVITHPFGDVLPYEIRASHFDVQFTSCSSDDIVKPISAHQLEQPWGPQEVCQYSSESYGISDPVGTIIEWSLEPQSLGDIVQVSDREISVLWKESGTGTLQASYCSGDVSLSVEVFSLPDVEVIGVQPICTDETALIYTTTPALSHRWMKEDGTLLGSSSTINLGPGHYRVEVSDDNGCSTTRVFVIEELPLPVAQFTPSLTAPICVDILDGILLVAVIDDPNVTIDWFLDGQYVASGTSYLAWSFGKYSIEVTAPSGCVNTSYDYYLSACCPGDPCFAENVCNNPSGCPYLPYDFDVANSSSYCSEFTLKVESPDVIPSTVRWGIVNENGNAYQVGVGPILNYNFPNVGLYRLVVGGKISGYNYSMPACDHQQLLFVTVPMKAKIGKEPSCGGEAERFLDITEFLLGSEPIAWSWNFGDPVSGDDNTSNLQNPNHIFSSPGTYTVRLEAESASGCLSRVIQTIVVPEPADPDVSFSPQVCEGNMAEFELLNALYEVVWDFGDGQPPAQIDGDSVSYVYGDLGVYTVFVSGVDARNCPSQSSFEVEVLPNNLDDQIVVVPSDSLCDGETAILTAPPDGQQWLWNTKEMTESIAVDSAAGYHVSMTDSIGCFALSDPVDIFVLPTPNAFVQGRILAVDDDQFELWEDSLDVCEGEAFMMEVFTDIPSHYEWETGHLGKTIVVDPVHNSSWTSGSYDIAVVAFAENGGCSSDTQFFHLDVYPLPENPSIGVTQGGLCLHTAPTLSVLNPEAGVSYHWSNGQEGLSINPDNAGIYEVTAVNDQGCTAISNKVEILPGPRVDLIPKGCIEECDSLVVCIPAEIGIASINVYEDGVLVGSFPALEEWVVHQTTVLNFVVTGHSGCVVESDPLDVTIEEVQGTVTVSTYLDVDGDGVLSAADTLVSDVWLTVQGEEPGSVYSGVTSQGQYGFLNLLGDDYVVSFDQDSLDSSYTILTDSIAVSLVLCNQEEEVTLLLGADCEVLISDTLLFGFCPDQVPGVVIGDSIWTEPGLYTYHTLTDGGCDSTAFIFIEKYAGMAIDFEVRDSCEMSGSISLSVEGNGPFKYNWSPDVSQDRVALDLDEGVYNIEVEDAFGCSQEVETEVVGLMNLDFALDPLFTGAAGNTLALTISGDTTADVSLIEWTPSLDLSCSDCWSPLHTIRQDSQEYQVLILDDWGCSYLLETLVIGGRANDVVFVPNVFSPNNDGVNDRFRVYPQSDLVVELIQIYDRWGNMVYSESTPSAISMSGWDGSYQGEELNSAVFLWRLVGANTAGERVHLQGDVTLLR